MRAFTLRGSSERAIIGAGAILALALALTALIPGRAFAQSAKPVPPRQALQLMLKVLTYDKTFAGRGSGDFVILLATEPTQTAARDEALAAITEFEGSTLEKRPLRFVEALLGPKTPPLREAIAQTGAQAILVVRGMSDAGIQSVKEAARESQLYTLSLEPALVEKSIMLSVEATPTRAQIVVSVSAVHWAKATFESSALRLARAHKSYEDVAPWGPGMTAPQETCGSSINYPPEAVQAKVAGTMSLRCVITAAGNVENCRVLKGLPFLDQAVITALTARHFTPATQDGKPIAVDYPFEFKLIPPPPR